MSMIEVKVGYIYKSRAGGGKYLITKSTVEKDRLRMWHQTSYGTTEQVFHECQKNEKPLVTSENWEEIDPSAPVPVPVQKSTKTPWFEEFMRQVNEGFYDFSFKQDMITIIKKVRDLYFQDTGLILGLRNAKDLVDMAKMYRLGISVNDQTFARIRDHIFNAEEHLKHIRAELPKS